MTIVNVTICAKVAIYADNDKRLAYVFNYFKMLQVAQDLAIILFVPFIILVFNSHDLNNEVHRKTRFTLQLCVITTRNYYSTIDLAV